MTGKEIIEKFKELDVEISELASLEIEAPEGFEYSKEIQDSVTKKEELRRQMEMHPSYRLSWSKQREDGEYMELYNAWMVVPYAHNLMQAEYLESLGIGEAINVEHYGGEDMGSTYYDILHFPKHDVYLKVEGYYTSYNGTDYNGWEDVSVVVPREKVITIFEAVK